ncbi:hypothetical protein AYO21_02194 [Fonsecaea monophora]|uniref:Alpha/beta hydrolase fold-3 domain-containing protein n=1 Tax=Fonsecaea monophora TaxID=254056 RepID=A0A177FH86_9EURO|nr:hypothetical protein AYO21_02194 [Fonsecaea monophora]KAH0844048.1 AB hydrolase superfamily protein B1A11.02 [Fonsecaea pedrosoi]OAG43608.1 hypothetical protein AYO21_02194 [Fonsecaea monophora]
MAEYPDQEEYLLGLSQIDAELNELLEQNPPPAIDYSNLEGFTRMYLENAERAKGLLGETPDGVKCTELQYPTRDGAFLRAKLFQPTSSNVILGRERRGSPLVMLIHGGGFCLGSPEGEEQTCRNLVLALNATCVAVAYRLGPRYPFPYAPNDCWDALRWCASNAASWNANPDEGFVVGGSSAGANIAAVLAHRARDEGFSPPLTGLYLAIPLLCPKAKIPEQYRRSWISHEQNANAPVLPEAALEMFMGGYQPDENDSVNFAVFNHPRGHGDLPPTYFQVDGMDPLRDDSLIYEAVLREEYKVKTKMDVYPGLPHGHWSFFPMLKASIKARRDQVEGLGWLLGRKPDCSRLTFGPSAGTF